MEDGLVDRPSSLRGAFLRYGHAVESLKERVGVFIPGFLVHLLIPGSSVHRGKAAEGACEPSGGSA